MWTGPFDRQEYGAFSEIDFHGRCGVSSRFHSAFLSSLSRSRVPGIGFVLLESLGLPACLPLSVLDIVSPPILMIPRSLSLFVCLCLSLCHHLCAYASLSLTVSILSPLLSSARYLPTFHFLSLTRPLLGFKSPYTRPRRPPIDGVKSRSVRTKEELTAI